MLLKKPPAAGLHCVRVPLGQTTMAAFIGSAVIVTLGACSSNVQYPMRAVLLTGEDTSLAPRARL
jgi:hypothetical protein